MFDTFELLVQDWRNKMAAEFGSDVNTSENSNFYKLMFPILENLFNQYNQINDFINNKYAYTASGVYLDRFMSNYNITRKQPAKATVKWTTTDSSPSLEFLGLQVQDDLGNVFEATGDFENVSGSSTWVIYMEALEAGSAANIQAGTLNNIITPKTGLGTGTNLEDAAGGQDQETDSELRNRFLAGRQGKGYWNIEGIYRALIELDGVESVFVEENDQNIIVNGLPPHSIHCIVDGGDNFEIAETIFDKSDVAIEKHGNLSVSFFRAVGNNTDQRTISFSRPETTNIEIQYSFVGVVDETKLQQYLIEYVNNAGIGAKLSSFKASNYIENKIDISSLEDFNIEMRIEGTSNWLTYITLQSIQKPNGVIV